MSNDPDKYAEFREYGRQGGKLGGKIRAEKLSPEQRSEIGKAGAKTRWEKHKKKKPGKAS